MKKSLLKHVISSRMGDTNAKRPTIPTYAYRGCDQHIPSKVDTTGDTTVHPKQVYTGDKIIGIATMHKSNAVPIFNEQAAVDVTHMRR